jgi:hypothetical protein
VRKIMLLKPSRIIVHRPIPSVLMLLTHLIHIRVSIMRVPIVGICVVVGTVRTLSLRYVLRWLSRLTLARPCRIWRVLATILWFHMTVASGRLAHGGLRLHIRPTDTKPASRSLLCSSRLLGLAVRTIVVRMA